MEELTFRELRSSACTVQTRLLSFPGARIAAEESGALEGDAERGIVEEECLADAGSDCLCLPILASSNDRRLHIEDLLAIGNRERRNHFLREDPEEVFLGGLSIHRHFAASCFEEPDAGDGGFRLPVAK